MSGRRQVAALPVRQDPKSGRLEVLLVTTLDTGRWVIPKGWPWPDRPDHEAAAEEAREEAGVVGTVAKKSVGSYSYGKRRKDGSVTDVTVQVFRLDVAEEKKSWPEKKRRRREWVAPDEAAERVLEEGLKDILAGLVKVRKKPG
jgi:8-oxo-dGTP pyrophosphatase MutT (NUDIX family)